MILIDIKDTLPIYALVQTCVTYTFHKHPLLPFLQSCKIQRLFSFDVYFSNFFLASFLFSYLTGMIYIHLSSIIEVQPMDVETD